ERRAADPLRLHQPRHERSLDQRRLTGAAGATDQQKGCASARLRRQLLRCFGYHAIASEEDGRVLEPVPLQPTEGRAGPERLGLHLVARQRSDTPLNELAQRLLQTLCELLKRLILLIGREKHPAIGKVSLPERIERIELLQTAFLRL